MEIIYFIMFVAACAVLLMWAAGKSGKKRKTNRFVPKSVSAGEPEYDGFSRRDRHHVVVGTAHIKKEDHIDEVAEHRKENKAAG